jgi:hypothetical protein
MFAPLDYPVEFYSEMDELRYETRSFLSNIKSAFFQII